jgi:hypothetical protein
VYEVDNNRGDLSDSGMDNAEIYVPVLFNEAKMILRPSVVVLNPTLLLAADDAL